jgi:hypothetical protein
VTAVLLASFLPRVTKKQSRNCKRQFHKLTDGSRVRAVVRRMKRVSVLLLIVVVTATVAVGALHGRMTLRWGPRPDMQAAAAMLENVPGQCGSWRMTTSSKMSSGEIRMLRCAGYVSRQYVNEKTGDRVSVGIVFGPPGAISEHTPEVCFSSRDFTQLGKRERTEITRRRSSGNKVSGDEFWFVDFQKNTVASQKVRVYWAWSTGGRWQAPNGPKSAFAGSRHLYKMQLSATMWSRESAAMPDAPNDTCGRFLSELLPAAQRYLVTEAAERALQTDARE